MTESIALDDEERARRQRARNWALLVVLAGLSLLFYVLTMVRFGGTP